MEISVTMLTCIFRWFRTHIVFGLTLHTDVTAVDWADVVVVGGGGLVYCNESEHFAYMAAYLDRVNVDSFTHLLRFSLVAYNFDAKTHNRPSRSEREYLNLGVNTYVEVKAVDFSIPYLC